MMKHTVLTFLIFLAFTASSFAIEKKTIDFVVGVDGDFKAAIAAAGSSGASANNRFVIFIPDGEYELTKLTGDEHGKTIFPSSSYISIIGQSLEGTTLWNTTNTEGISTTATIYFPKNNNMYMQDITLQNRSTVSSGNATRQVVIQQNEGDKFIYKNVRLLSGQDTYYTKKGRTYWEGGEIHGTVDFICGGGDVFFEGTKLVVTRSGGVITASQNPGDWGYIFNNASITVSNNGFNGTFHLGRSWGHAKTVFLNTKMIAQPKGEGWGDDMNSAPVVFGEYNSKDGNGNAVNTSQRKTEFNGGKDPSTAKTLKTVWNASDAANYTLKNVLGGSDNWDPTTFTAQVSAPTIEQQGAEIVWNNNDNARCWVIFVNGKYKANVITPSFSLEGISTGSKITVRAANSMGGLGSSSNEITTLESNVTYYNVTLNEPVGGSIETSFTGSKVAEGKTATFTAKPLAGWTFAGWSGSSASKIKADEASVNITVTGDINLIATFSARGLTTFQAEEGVLENAISESTNAGFAGSGYVNFGTGTSYVKVPVYVDVGGEYKLTMTYANGSKAPRSLSISTDKSEAQELEFSMTDAWTAYEEKEISIKLPQGASYITFATVGGNDGPNLDQVELTLTKADENTSIPKIAKNDSKNITKNRVRLYNVNGQLLRESLGTQINTQGLNRGIYLLQIESGNTRKQTMIQVR